MKVVITMHLGERLGGAENALWTFLRTVDRDRIEPVVVFLDSGAFASEVAELGLRTLMVPHGRLRRVHRTAIDLVRLARIFRAEQPDLVLNWLTKAQLHGAAAATLSGLAPRNAWWQWDFPELPADRVAAALPGRHIAACSAAVADAQQEIWPHHRPRIIWPGIDPPPRLRPDEVAALRRRLRLPPDRPVVGIVGRLIPWKGQHHVLGALARLRAEGHDVHGLIVGGTAHGIAPEYEPHLRRIAHDLSLDEAVTFAGHQPDGMSYMQLMDVCVNASAREPFGIVVLEAMASGVPMVAVDHAGPREIIKSGESGVLAPSNSAEDLATAVRPLLGDTQVRDRIVRSGHRRYEESFTARHMVSQIEDWLEVSAGRTASREPTRR